MTRTVVLTGGVGGAKLVKGLGLVLPPDQITAIVNCGDDFRHLGLAVSPDIDTLLYTLSGKANAQQGWGREGETWQFMEAVRSLGGDDWFLLGDGDMALHVLRSHWLAAGLPLSEVTARFAAAWNLPHRILPMTDASVATHLDTDEGAMPFQQYFVARRCEPSLRAIHFAGAACATPATGVIEAITDQLTEAILIAPSNPWLSIDPILAVPGIRDALISATAPVVAVSPIVGGQAVKGPTAKLMRELDLAVNNLTIADHYHGIIDALLVDERDDASGLAIPHVVTNTLMLTPQDCARVAREALTLAQMLVRPGA